MITHPFKDYGYGAREDIEDLLNMQKQMYRELIQAYMIAQSEEQNLDNEVGSIARKKEDGKENEASPTSPSPGI